jgi:hypothetical protein
MRIWLEIQRTTGVEHREITPDGARGIATGLCPGCGATPLVVQGHGRHRYTRDTFRVDGTALCCGDPVGHIYATMDTIFGLEEDEAVLNGRARVY